MLVKKNDCTSINFEIKSTRRKCGDWVVLKTLDKASVILINSKEFEQEEPISKWLLASTEIPTHLIGSNLHASDCSGFRVHSSQFLIGPELLFGSMHPPKISSFPNLQNQLELHAIHQNHLPSQVKSSVLHICWPNNPNLIKFSFQRCHLLH